jgi:aldehyde dehydrogenase (NAD(P)+)
VGAASEAPDQEDGVDTAAIDEVLDRLQKNRTRWARLPIPDKIELLRDVQQRVLTASQRWVDAEVDAKGLAPDSPLVGAEVWMAGPFPVVSWLSASIETLTALQAGEDLLKHVPLRTSITGNLVARVMPHDIWDRLLESGVTGDVWMQPGITEDNIRDNMASFYRQADPEGALTLVLGAGNVASIPALDVLDRMINHGDVVICKMNPVNDYVGPIFEHMLAPLIRDGFLAFAYGGGDVGAYLTDHEAVQSVHITGSARTHDLIVYGGGEEGQRRKAADDRRLAKPVFSELGGVGATIVLPGPWTTADFAYQAENVVTQKLLNSGHVCVANQVLILPAEWDGRADMLDAVRRELDESEDRAAYYPGTDAKLQALRDEAPDAEVLGGENPRLLVELDPTEEHYGFTTEFFGPAMVTTSLPGDAEKFLINAVEFCNDRLMGTLSVNLIVHPQTRKELGEAFDRAIADLRYGGIGINVWSAYAFLLARGAWGAYPGHTYDDIQSGIGVVHNALMFDRAEKTVVEAPFHPFPRSLRHGQTHTFPKPPWFLRNRTAASTGKRFTAFAAAPSVSQLPGLFASALRG